MSKASEVIRRLREKNPEMLADVKTEETDIDISKVDDMTAPSEIRKMSEAIKRRRLSAEGLEKQQLDELLQRIGKKR